MYNIKVGCIPARQAVIVDKKILKIGKFVKKNRIAFIIGGIAMILLSIYSVLIINFINLIKIMY